MEQPSILSPVEFVTQHYSALREEIWALAREKQKYLVPCELPDQGSERKSQNLIHDGHHRLLLISNSEQYRLLDQRLEEKSAEIRRALEAAYPDLFKVSILNVDPKRIRKLDKCQTNAERIKFLAQFYSEVRELKPYQLLVINEYYLSMPCISQRFDEVDFDSDDITGTIFNDGSKLDCRYKLFSLVPPSNFFNFYRELGLTLQQATILYQIEKVASEEPRIFNTQSELEEDFTEWPYAGREKLN